MQVNFSPEQEAQLDRLAAHAGLDPEGFVKNAVMRAVDETAEFRAAVRAGLDQADRNELVEDDVVAQWLERKERT